MSEEEKEKAREQERRLREALRKIYREEDIDQETIDKISDPLEIELYHEILTQQDILERQSEEIDALNMVISLLELGLS